jgi:hypothetical protein
MDVEFPSLQAAANRSHPETGPRAWPRPTASSTFPSTHMSSTQPSPLRPPMAASLSIGSFQPRTSTAAAPSRKPDPPIPTPRICLPLAPASAITNWAAAAAAVRHPFSRPTLARLLRFFVHGTAGGACAGADAGGLPAAFASVNFRRPGLLDMGRVEPGERAAAAAMLTNGGSSPAELMEALLIPGGSGPFRWGDLPPLPLVLEPGESKVVGRVMRSSIAR